MTRGRHKDGPANGPCSVLRVTIRTQELTQDDLELIEFARTIVDANTDGEGGIYTMGAAVRAADGTMYGGINLFHFTGGPCAELVALGHARASGARELSTIVAVGNAGRGPVGPCGRDRQVLFDYHPNIRVILPTAEGVRSVHVRDLMPLGAVWTVEEGTQEFDPAIFEDGPTSR
jgi:cytidine deaminase